MSKVEREVERVRKLKVLCVQCDGCGKVDTETGEGGPIQGIEPAQPKEWIALYSEHWSSEKYAERCRHACSPECAVKAMALGES